MGSTTAATQPEQGKPIRVGVVGLGYFGTFHAQKYALSPGCELVAVVDRNLEGAEKFALGHGAQAYTDHRDLIGRVDAVSIVTPVAEHYGVAKDFLLAGVHVLVEKAVTETTEQADELIQLAKERGLVLQVGHLERFNPAFSQRPADLHAPSYIETHRLTGFREHTTNVSVVMDLMVHDLDLVHTLVCSPVKSVQAKGVSVYSDALDLVNAVVHFENGAVANLTASRVSSKPQRTIHLFQHQAHICLDMQNKSIVTQQQKADGSLEIETRQLDSADTLRAEVQAFLHAIQFRSQPVVSGEDGRRALDTAIRIAQAVEHGRNRSEPLLVSDGERCGYVTHDCHPETREPFFSRTSFVKETE